MTNTSHHQSTEKETSSGFIYKALKIFSIFSTKKETLSEFIYGKWKSMFVYFSVFLLYTFITLIWVRDVNLFYDTIGISMPLFWTYMQVENFAYLFPISIFLFHYYLDKTITYKKMDIVVFEKWSWPIWEIFFVFQEFKKYLSNTYIIRKLQALKVKILRYKKTLRIVMRFTHGYYAFIWFILGTVVFFTISDKVNDSICLILYLVFVIYLLFKPLAKVDFAYWFFYLVPFLLLVYFYIRFADFQDQILSSTHLVLLLSYLFRILKRDLSKTRVQLIWGVFILYHIFLLFIIISPSSLLQVKIGDINFFDYNSNYSIYKDRIYKNNWTWIFPSIEVKTNEMIYTPEISKIADYKEFMTIGIDDIPQATLVYRNFNFASLPWVFLPYAKIHNSSFQYANLVWANLHWSILRDTSLIWAILIKTNLSNTDLYWTNFTDAYASFANISWVLARDPIFSNTDLRGANFKWSFFWWVKFNSNTKINWINLDWSLFYSSTVDWINKTCHKDNEYSLVDSFYYLDSWSVDDFTWDIADKNWFLSDDISHQWTMFLGWDINYSSISNYNKMCSNDSIINDALYLDWNIVKFSLDSDDWYNTVVQQSLESQDIARKVVMMFSIVLHKENIENRHQILQLSNNFCQMLKDNELYPNNEEIYWTCKELSFLTK